MESDVPVHRSRVVLKTVNRMPRTFMSQIYAVDTAVTGWVSLGSLSYAACAFYLSKRDGDRSCAAGMGEQVASVEWTFQVQTVAFGAVLLLNLLNLGMRQHLLPFKCNLLLLYINGLAFVTDLLLWRGDATILLSSSGRAFAPLRYVQWCHSTPTMIYMLALLADCGGWQLAVPLLSDVAMVVSGLAACYLRGLLKDAMTVVSFGTFVVVLYYVHSMFHKTLSGDLSPEQRSTLRTVLALLLALWSAFPVVWLAADWHLMGLQAEAVCWGLCDYLAKVVFSSQLWQSNLAEVQLRQDRALEAWEASNRVEAVARLTALLKQRDDLLSTLSHELRTPLAGIVALSETLCQEVSAALPASAQNLATVRATATCMLNIVTSTLDSFASRRVVEQGSVQHLCEEGPDSVAPSVPLSPLDLRALLEIVTTVLRPLAHDGVMIVSDLPSNLPPVAADATRLSQVLYNLVGNAMRFTTHGEVRIAARVVLPESLDAAQGRAGDNVVSDPSAVTSSGTGASGGGSIWRYTRRRLSQSSSSSCSSVISFPVGTMVEVSVEDTGIGIAQELLDELFLPYRTGQTVQGDNAAAESLSPDHVAFNGSVFKSIGGTGLGLYLVRLALRAQGSVITAESAPGIGSVFRFRLQVAQQQQANQQGSQSNHASHANSIAPHPHRKTVEQQQHPSIFDESLTCQRLPDQSQPHADDESGPQVQISVSVCEREVQCSSNTCSATAASEASGGGRILTAPSSPKPTNPSSPKPWNASATARHIKLSSATTVSSVGGAAGNAGDVAVGIFSSVGPTIFRAPASQRPSTGALPLQDVPSPVGGQKSLHAQQHRNLLLPPPPPPSTADMVPSGQCRPSCMAGCCTSELSCTGPISVVYSSGTQDAVPTDITASAASDGLPSADAAIVFGSGLAVLTQAVGVLTTAITPAPTPTAATSRVSTAAVTSLTPFDVAHTIEEGRPLPRARLRPNFRHRNNGILQVLSVDDDPINQLVAGQMLTSQSWKVVKCMNGPEALVHLQLMPKPGTVAAAASAAGLAQSVSAAASTLAAASAAAQPLLLPVVLPDCILLDVMMPGMSGFEVCRKLRQHFSSAQLPIIIVSAKSDSAAVEEAFESGADDYMTKPYKRTEMVARIRAQIKIRDSVLDAAAASALTSVMTPSTPQVELASVPTQAVVATGSVPIVTPGSTPRAYVATLTARGLLGCGSAAFDLPSPSPSSAVHAPSPSQTLQRTRPTSVDVFMVKQPTPGSIKMRMEASRRGLDCSWDKVGLYKRESMLGRTAAVEGVTAPWDASARVLPTEAPLTAPAAVLSFLPTDLQPVDAGLEAAAVPSVSAESLDILQDRVKASSNGPLGGADAADMTVRPVGTVVVATDNLGPTTGASAVAPVTFPGIAVDTTQSSSELAIVTAAGTAIAVAGTGVVPEAANPSAEPSNAAEASASSVGANRANGEPGEAAALLREVLTEVQRSRAAEADIEKLTTRVAELRTACCTLAAERDGWRRQARDLRALLAAGFSGAAVAAAAAVSLPSGQANLQSKTDSSTPPQLTISDALAAAQGSRSSGDSLGAAVNGSGGTLHGMVQNGAVAAQLEDLKKEAALLRQQLSVALASVGGNLSIPLGVTDTVGSRTFAPASGGPTARPQRTLLQLPRTSDSPQSTDMVRACAGDRERSGGGGDSAQGWGLGYGPPPDIFLTTETSGLSAGSSHGGGTCDDCSSGEGTTPRVKCSGAAAASRRLPSLRIAHGSNTGPEANTTLGKESRRACARSNSPSRSALAMSAPAGRIVLGPEKGEAAKQVASMGLNEEEISALGDYCPAPLTASAGPTATQSTMALIVDATAEMPRSLSPSKADPPRSLGDMQGSSTASNGGCWVMASNSMEEEISQPNSAGRAPVMLGSTFRSSRPKPASGASAGTGGILRMLCSKGAAPAASPHVSPRRRNSHQY